MKFGWIPDTRDPRDYHLRMPQFKDILPRTEYQSSVDLRPLDTPVFDQGDLGSCTANAACGLLQFIMKQAAGKYTPLSRLYLYKMTRMHMNTQGDTGASLRDTAMAVTMNGVCPELYWNYDPGRFDELPKWMGSEAFIHDLADNYEGTHYVRLDPDGCDKQTALRDIKDCVRSKFPVMFGTLVYQQIMNVNMQGDIWYPSQGERPVGGHALLIMGYDDERDCIGTPSKGAFLIRNSWSPAWGNQGYGWLPYAYLLEDQAQDFWTFLGSKYVTQGDFA